MSAATGKKVWIIDYAVAGRRYRKVLGTWPTMREDEARELASKARAKARKGEHAEEGLWFGPLDDDISGLERRLSDCWRSSTNSVGPLISANSDFTVLRSPSSDAASSDSRIASDNLGGSSLAAAGPSAAVHWPQNLNPGGFWKWHFTQTSASGAVH